jgi:hypothetical protein
LMTIIDQNKVVAQALILCKRNSRQCNIHNGFSKSHHNFIIEEHSLMHNRTSSPSILS